MYKYIMLFFLFFLSNRIMGQSDTVNVIDSLGRKQGLFRSKMVGAKTYLYSIENYLDDIRNGKCIYYYDNGQILTIAHYLRDTLHGEKTTYREDGTLFQIENFKMGQLHGLKKYFDYTGKLVDEVEYKEDVSNGIVRAYYPSGRIRSETQVLDGLENGTRKIFADTEVNEITREFDFKDGLRIKSRFYSNGKLIKEEKE